MLKSTTLCALALGAVLVTGCKKEDEAPPTVEPKSPPTTMPMGAATTLPSLTIPLTLPTLDPDHIKIPQLTLPSATTLPGTSTLVNPLPGSSTLVNPSLPFPGITTAPTTVTPALPDAGNK